MQGYGDTATRNGRERSTRIFPNGEWEAFALVDDLAGSKDTRDILIATTQRFAELFGPWRTFGLLVADAEFNQWRILTLARPGATETQESWAALSAFDLEEASDFDGLTLRFGVDVSSALSKSENTERFPRLRWALLSPSPVFFTEEGESLLKQVREALPPFAPACAVLAAGWQRPRGGRGYFLLGYDRPLETGEAEQMLPRFAPCVRLVAQLSLYPGYSALVERMNIMAQSLRRNTVHDLKTPLTVIKGYAELLQQPGVGDDATLRTEMVGAIVEQADRMLDDLRDLLIPLEEGWKPHFEPVDLTQLVQKAVMHERHTARASQHRFQVRGTSEPVFVQADRRKIQRVLENLLSNAVKYSPGEDKTVTLTLQVEGQEARIAFTDEGIGMTDEQLRHVLSGTGRVVNSDLGIEGTGFGLDSVRRVLQAHNGRLEAHSEPGVGSTFTAVLPLSPPAPPAVEVSPSPPLSPDDSA